ncbi:arginyl-tRNA--protein transferase 2 isoform X2 [Syzygium oleosum]|uniref:arginyl-tRNA--protein transferase 2 isoform X2 n=1 Tax=Syzygium oleosum TaxID=219896 RepID=UPI0024B90E2A|nr:arginyl-tRNA--protein transferase 2 isoform X2 [Syzygium oleosum]
MAVNHRGEASSSGGGGGGGGGDGGGRGETVVEDCGRRRSSCGYCRSPDRSSVSHDLLDRGWRRCGSYLYKPDMSSTCCPSYTIRLKAADFSPSKEQNRVYRRVERFLDGTRDTEAKYELLEDLSTSKVACDCECHGRSSSATAEPSVGKEEDKNEPEQFMHYLSDAIDKAVHTCVESETFPANVQLPKASVKGVSPTKKKKLIKGLENLLYTSNIGFQLAAALRRARSEKKNEKQSKLSGNSAEDQLPSGLLPQTIGEKLAQSLSQMGETSGLLIQARDGHLNFYSIAEHTSVDKAGHEKSLSKEFSTRSGNKRRCLVRCCNCCSGKRRKLEILLKRSTFEPEEFELYRRYQLKVHNDKPAHVTESAYRRFLVDTPLVFVPSTGDGSVPPCGFGSFHQTYVIDGRLVAVGVVDILPKCLSSKYLFWDPDFAFLSLGKYSALQEITWVKENQVHCPSLQYYYLGYYIHSCSKMRYKAEYRPPELLCPLRYRWVPYNVAKPLLDRSKYVVLSDYKDQDEKPLLPPVADHISEHQHDESEHKDLNDLLVEDEEMVDLEEEESDVESESESSNVELSETEDSEIGNTLIGLRGSRLRYKDLQGAFGLVEGRYMEAQVQRYMRVVGRELSKRMVYSLG